MLMRRVVFSSVLDATVMGHRAPRPRDPARGSETRPGGAARSPGPGDKPGRCESETTPPAELDTLRRPGRMDGSQGGSLSIEVCPRAILTILSRKCQEYSCRRVTVEFPVELSRPGLKLFPNTRQ